MVGNKIYWGSLTTWPSYENAPIPYGSGIHRSNLDGSHVENIPFGTLDGSHAENISSEPWGRGYLPAITSIALYIPHPTSVSTSSHHTSHTNHQQPRPQLPQPLQRQHPDRLPPRHPRLGAAGNLQRLRPTRAHAGEPVPARRLLPSPLGRPRPARRSAGSRRLSHALTPPRRSADAAIALPQVADRKRRLLHNLDQAKIFRIFCVDDPDLRELVGKEAKQYLS